LQFSVPVPDYPYFHPADSTIISDVIGIANCKTYSFFDTAHGTWTFTGLARQVKAQTTLLLRSRDVTTCLGLDNNDSGELSRRLSKKRALSVTHTDATSHMSKRVSQATSDDEYFVSIYSSIFATTEYVVRIADLDDHFGSAPPPSSSPISLADDGTSGMYVSIQRAVELQ
jgi:hypothetical protein